MVGKKWIGKKRIKNCDTFAQYWTMTESLKKKIAGYSAMAVAVLARSNAADAQVIYTDINPDHEMQGWHSNYFLDLNNDGIDDFKFNFLFVSSSSGGSSWFYD